MSITKLSSSTSTLTNECAVSYLFDPYKSLKASIASMTLKTDCNTGLFIYMFFCIIHDQDISFDTLIFRTSGSFFILP